MKKLHMIGNAHLDPVWLWDWREGYQENRATFKSALDRMEEFDDFVFTSSSAQFYKWIEESEPALFARIKKRVEEGRWVICGGWWVQPDCNIPSGESFARHSLLSQTYFKEKFGVTAKTGYCVDSFGHNAMLPQILKKSGMESYVFMRPGPHEKDLPARAFLWESPDGSQVRAFRIPYAYCISQDIEGNIDKLLTEFSPGVDHMMCFYGVGNHGGVPTVENIKTIHRLMQSRKDIDLVMDSPQDYFAAIETCTLPVVKGDLQHHAAGCYAAESAVKFMNRRAENALCSAEKFTVMALMSGLRDYSAPLDSAWEQVLFNQFHDILAGSSLERAYYDARNQLGEAVAVASRCENSAIQALSFRIGIPYEPRTLPVVVFNPHAWPVTAPVEVENGIFSDSLPPDELAVMDCDGALIPHQQIDAACRLPNRRRITFQATVPALGYALFTLKRSPKKAVEPANGCCLENELLCVRFDPETGWPSSIYDKRSGKEVLAAPVKARVIDDDTDTWGHTLKRLDKTAGEFTLTALKPMDFGPVRSCVRVTSKFGSSTLTQTYSLYAGDDTLRVRASVNWQEHCRALKLDFPVNANGGGATVEIPFGYLHKEQNGLEEPMQSWADLSGKDIGLSILNDGKYSVDFRDDTIGLTVLRSPVYAQHDPYALQDGEAYAYMDQGISEFTYVLVPHGGCWKSARTIQKAAVLNQPLVSITETFHEGCLPPRAGFIQIEQENIVMTALKKAHRGAGIILRLYESFGKRTDAVIRLFGTEIHTQFGQNEIKTLRLVDTTVCEVNLPEWEV